ncbi:MAG: EAL domain-containing protein [Vicinamibacteria bacterium]
MREKGGEPSPGVLRAGWLGRATEPYVLFPALALIGLASIFWTTLSVIRFEDAAARHAAALSSRELGETYEAQVVRALREIDQALKVVKFAWESSAQPATLADLREKSLLPPDLVFRMSVANSVGEIVASTRPEEATSVSQERYFLAQHETDTLSVGQPSRNPESGEWEVHFSRRLTRKNAFAGIVILAVDASYFVSGYEPSKLGERGVLGILGTDGIFRARRTGDAVSAGRRVSYAAVVDEADEDLEAAPLRSNPWDGVFRYTSARQLYEFPLAVVVGLSAEEQLMPTRQRMWTYVGRALGASLLLIAVMTALGRMSHQLAKGRQRAVEEQVAHAARVEYLAYHDGLTTLPNRSLFSKLLGQSIQVAHRYGRSLAVLFLDLDRFKQINDTLGHEAGDQLLKEVAERLTACLRGSDTVARLGGDEFVVLLPEIQDEKYIAAVAQKILAACARPFLLVGQDFRVTASIGICTYPQDGLDEQTLTKNADIAMYKAKEEGKNNFQFYSARLNATSLERLALESALRRALERSEFQLHYQTKREIRTGRITGLEALLRWQHPDLGMVAPMKFIPMAEETGLIVPIGKWVLKTACLQNMAWQKQGLPSLSIAINLTSRQFSDEHLLIDLDDILRQTGMDPRYLELEIGESLLMRDVESTLRILSGLKSMGIRIAIDDFGAGYSSLSTLRQFPLDSIKIDRSFIRDATSVAEDKDLTQAIIAMGRTLSLTVVAQGVETKEQADFLRLNACDEVQGFYLNKPLPADEIASLLRDQGVASAF